MEAVIDLGQLLEVNRVTVDCLRAQGPWIFLPSRVEIFLSVDGTDWTRAGETDIPLVDDSAREVVGVAVTVPSGRGRYLRVLARNRGSLPSWHPGSGEKAWLFVDEIVVE